MKLPKLKLSYILWFTVAIDTATIIGNLFMDRPVSVNFVLLGITTGWLISQLELEELRGD